MLTHRCKTRAAALVAATVALGFAVPAAGQQAGAEHAGHAATMPTSGLRAELVRDVESLEEKYLGLADAMAGKYDWRPGEGVRSVSEVLMHVAGANFMLPTMIGIEPPEELRASTMDETFVRLQELEKVADADSIRSALRHSFAHVKHTIAMTPDDQLDATTELFGQEATKRAALNMLITHMHEHLGQSIAYARTNGVVPPWSAEGGE